MSPVPQTVIRRRLYTKPVDNSVENNEKNITKAVQL